MCWCRYGVPQYLYVYAFASVIVAQFFERLLTSFLCLFTHFIGCLEWLCVDSKVSWMATSAIYVCRLTVV